VRLRPQRCRCSVARLAVCLLIWLQSGSGAVAEDRALSTSRKIAEKDIVGLAAELQKAEKASSKIRRRRALKGVVREGEALIKSAPASANRFRVLEIILQSQKRLLGLESSDRNRRSLLETCAELAKAPDKFANLRFEADMLLSERELSRKNADVRERTEALSALIARYRDTSGEAKSLMLASLIAPKLEAFDLEKQIFRALDERFAGDYDVIEWRRKHHGYAHERVLFTGTYSRTDGTSITFPIDGMGHTSVLVFWSEETPDLAERLALIKDLQSRFPGWFDVFSFNVDELGDAGEKALKAMGLDWTALKLPDGRKSQTYRVVAKQDPIAVRVNAHGHAFLPSTLIDTLTAEMSMEQNLDDPRYLAQLQSLSVGDFLVTETSAGDGSSSVDGAVPSETLDAIQACFSSPPFRYRLSRKEALASYAKAEELCREAIVKFPKAPNLWSVRNRRMIALLGMWELAHGPKHLASASREARIALAGALPRGADVAARFCLAKDALRKGERPAHLVLSEFIEASGGDKASSSAYAAAAVLAMDANAVDQFAIYRAKLLESDAVATALWPVTSFLLDQNHSFRLFQANYYMPPSLARRIVRAKLRSNAAALDRTSGFTEPLNGELEALDGAKLSLPQVTDGKLTLLMFVEPPAVPPEGGSVEYPTPIYGATKEDKRGRKIETKGAMQHAFELADQHVHKRLQVIAAFLSEDRARVEALMEKHEWPCRAVLVPGGLRNPLVRRLGVLSADRVPNIVLLRPDGTIAWRLSGIVHPQLRSEGTGELIHVIARGMKGHVNAFEMESSIRAFEKGELEESVRLFSGPFPPPARPSPDEWTAPRLHGRALTYMKQKNWEAALADLDAAIEAHQWVFNAKKPCVCERVAKLRLAKAGVLERLGRAKEAEEARKLAATAKTSHGESRAGRLHERLESLYQKGSAASP